MSGPNKSRARGEAADSVDRSVARSVESFPEWAWQLLAAEYLKRPDAAGQQIGVGFRDQAPFRAMVVGERGDSAIACALRAIVKAGQPELGAACDEITVDALAQLRPWLEHDALCPAFTDEGAECTCGLTAAIVSIEAAEKPTRLRLIMRANPPSLRATDLSGAHTLFLGCFDASGHKRTIVTDQPVVTIRTVERPPVLDGLPQRHDGLRTVLQRPDVQEALAKALCHHNGGSWEAATEGGRNAFRGEAAKLVTDALAAPRESPPGPTNHAPLRIHGCYGCNTPPAERVSLPEGWQPGDPLPDDLTVHTDDRDGGHFAFRGHPLRQDRVRMDGATMLPVEQCPDCDRTVYVGNPPTMGFIAECGRRITSLAECGVKTCPVLRP